jgi:hypothetical protein
MRRKLLVTTAVLAAACCSAGAAGAKQATFTWDVANFDIQSAFGWTDEQLHANVGSIGFRVSGTIERNISCSIALLSNGKVIEQDRFETRPVDMAVPDVVGADGVTLQNLPDPSTLPDPLGTCSAVQKNDPPSFLAHLQDDLSAHMNVYATFAGQTMLVGFVAL